MKTIFQRENVVEVLGGSCWFLKWLIEDVGGCWLDSKGSEIRSDPPPPPRQNQVYGGSSLLLGRYESFRAYGNAPASPQAIIHKRIHHSTDFIFPHIFAS